MVFICDWFYYIHPNELNISRMILDISRHNLVEPDFSIFSQEVPLRSSNRFKAYRSYAIELKLGRMIQVISPQTRSESDFPVSPGGRCWGAPFEIFKSIHSLQYLSDCDETWYDNTKLSICTIGMSRTF